MRYEILQDTDPMAPSDWDNLGTLDVVSSNHFGCIRALDGAETLEDVERYLDAVAVVLVRHSDYGAGCTLHSVDDIADANGVLYATAESVQMIGTPADRLHDALRAEVEVWDTYYRGEVYVVDILDDDGETVDSCCGFYGYEYAEEEAREMLEVAEEAAGRELREADYWGARGVVTVG